MFNGECLILPLEGQPTLVVHPPELGTALLHTWMETVHGYTGCDDQEKYQATLLAEQGFSRSRIGIEKALLGVTASSFEMLRDALPHAELVDGSGFVSTVKITDRFC